MAPHGNDTSNAPVPLDDKIDDKIADSYVTSVFPDSTTQDFIPRGAVDRIVTRGPVIEELRLCDDGRGDNIAADDAGLIDFILNLGKKIFVISLLSSTLR